MKVLRSDLIRLFEALGWSAARKWRPGKMTGRLGSMVSMAQDGSVDSLEDEGLTELLQSLVEANGEVEIVSKESDLDEVGIDEQVEEVVEVQEESGEPVIEEKPEEPDEKVPRQTDVVPPPPILEPTKKKKPKKKKVSREKGKSEGAFFHVRSIKNRLYFAGLVIKKHGLDAGCSESLVEEVDGLCEKSNMVASRTQIKYAWHSINGFVNG